jgi:hypothetical protein
MHRHHDDDDHDPQIVQDQDRRRHMPLEQMK